MIRSSRVKEDKNWCRDIAKKFVTIYNIVRGCLIESNRKRYGNAFTHRQTLTCLIRAQKYSGVNQEYRFGSSSNDNNQRVYWVIIKGVGKVKETKWC